MTSSPKNVKIKLKGTLTVKDPVKDQVAAELANEIQSIDRNSKSLNTDKKKSHPISIPLRETTMKPKRNKTRTYINHFRITRRIHLERSTRYPIPFPENHAFCFMNPRSALCRTMI